MKTIKDAEKEEIEDFVDRCLSLNEYLDSLNWLQASPRVWTAVICERLKDILIRQHDFAASKKQIIDVLSRIEKNDNP